MKRKRVLEVLGCHSSTLMRYVDKGWIRVERMKNGFYRYNEEDVFLMAGKKIKKDNLCVAYCRVNKDTIKGKEKMAEQKHLVHEWAIKRGIRIDRVYEDYSVGTNAYREDFNQLVEDILEGEIGTVIILTKCRLVRFSYFMIRKMFRFHGTKIEIIAPHLEDPFYLDEQTEDIAKILQEAKMERIPQKPS